jgi:hypothetical protein
MNNIYCIYYLIFIYLILDNLRYINKSNVIKFNIICWIILLIINNPQIIHYLHIIGCFQILFGWLLFSLPIEQQIYRKLLLILWLLMIIRKDCIVSENIKHNLGQSYKLIFTYNQILIGVPILILLSKIKEIKN